jgi:hypothetical protein
MKKFYHVHPAGGGATGTRMRTMPLSNSRWQNWVYRVPIFSLRQLPE